MIGFARERQRVDFNLLSEDDLRAIHWATLDILRTAGVKILHSQKILKLLEKAGCPVNYDKQLARIPSNLVEEALDKKGNAITLCGRNPKYDARLDDRHVYITNDGNGIAMLDFETGKKRPSTKTDLAKTAIISDALDELHIYWPMVSAQDTPEHVRALHDLEASLANTEKHVMFETTLSPEVAQYQIEMAAAVVGSKEELRKRPIISSLHCPVAPLQHGVQSTQAAIEFAKARVPIVFFGMPQPGATGPATLAGSIVINNAEVLSGLVIAQLAAPGAPVIYGGGVAAFDMKAGSRAGGGPEHGLTGGAFAQLARHYGMPSIVGGGVSGAKRPGAQAAYEKFASLLPQILSGANAICGIGLLNDCTLLAFEELLIDTEIVRIIFRLAEGIEVNDETLSLDLIKKVGPGGNYLVEKHTLEHFKSEHFLPTVSDRNSYEGWLKEGRKSVADRAREKVSEILKTHKPKPLEDSTSKELARIIKEAEKALEKKI